MNISRKIFSYIEVIIRKIQVHHSIRQIIYNHESFVAMFHDVYFDNMVRDAYGISYSEFVNCINRLKNFGYKFISLKELEQLPKNTKEYCVITFDDGFASTYLLLNDYLKPEGIPFHLFITSDWINKEGYISGNQLIEMSNEGLCTIGSHSKTHPSFCKLSEDEVKLELVSSKLNLESLIGREVDEFAFPYGSKTAVSYKRLNCPYSYGYKRVFSTEPKTIKNIRFEDIIPRINGTEIAHRI